MTETVILRPSGAVAQADLQAKLDYSGAIDRLLRERNALILAHYYQDGEIQDLADFVGDSLDLSRKAVATDADVHRLLRRSLHGGSGENSEPFPDGADSGRAHWVFSGGLLSYSIVRR